MESETVSHVTDSFRFFLLAWLIYLADSLSVSLHCPVLWLIGHTERHRSFLFGTKPKQI